MEDEEEEEVLSITDAGTGEVFFGSFSFVGKGLFLRLGSLDGIEGW